MERSRELRGLVLALYRDWAARDPAYVEVFAEDDETIVIGTDEEEFIAGGRQARALLRQQLGELGRFTIEAGRLDAFVNGDMGFVVDDPGYAFEHGPAGRARCTVIFERRENEWRCVHFHMSVGQPNEVVVGRRLTTSVDAISDWVQDTKPDLDQTTSPQGTVTIAFTDAASSTATNEAMGDDRFVPLMIEHHEIVKRETKAADGTVVQSLGDGFLLAFPSARRAIESLMAIQRQTSALEWDVRIRMGVHTGEPTRHANDFYGRDVAYAARLNTAAAGGEILVSELVRSLVAPGGSVSFEGPRVLELKGFEGPQQAYAVRWL
jgi:adenylate cyclase